jgi:hypothetical protein
MCFIADAVSDIGRSEDDHGWAEDGAPSFEDRTRGSLCSGEEPKRCSSPLPEAFRMEFTRFRKSLPFPSPDSVRLAPPDPLRALRGSVIEAIKLLSISISY